MKIVEYSLKHRDIKTAVLSIDADTGHLISADIISKKYCPLGIDNGKALSSWWDRRAVPADQIGCEVFLKGDTPLEFMVKNMGLSLIDCYWVQPMNVQELKWKDVNLYENSLSVEDFIYSDKENLSPFKPSATTQGELKKRWIRKEDGTYLIKGNYDASCRQSINEVVASLVHEYQGRPHVHYELVDLKMMDGDTGIGCISKNFTNPKLEFIPAYDVTFASKKAGDESEYAHFLKYCIEHGCDKDETISYADYIILSDFLLSNSDRHLLNLGVLRNTNTMELVSLNPLFDTGNSMFFRDNYVPSQILERKVNSWGGNPKETKLLEYVHDFNNIDLSKLPEWKELAELYKKDAYSQVYLPNVEQGYKKKIELLWALQNGYSLNERSKSFYKNTFGEAKDIRKL